MRNLIQGQSSEFEKDLHVSVNVRIGNNSSLLLSFADFHHYLFERTKRTQSVQCTNTACPKIDSWKRVRIEEEKPTSSASNALETGGIVQCFPHCHLSDVHVELAYVGGRFLRDELLHFVSVVRDFPF